MSLFPRDREFWEEETQYIESVSPSRPGKSFRGTSSCFARYVHMQAGFCRRDGFQDLADKMLKHIEGR